MDGQRHPGARGDSAEPSPDGGVHDTTFAAVVKRLLMRFVVLLTAAKRKDQHTQLRHCKSTDTVRFTSKAANKNDRQGSIAPLAGHYNGMVALSWVGCKADLR